MEWKEKFLERYKELTNIDEFLKYSLRPLRKSIRVNTLKTSVKEIKKRIPGLKQIPWCEEGFWIEGEAIGNLPEHFLGYIYLQESASMIPPEVLSPKEQDMILDLCASPGSKTTQTAAKMRNNGLIIANDNQISRLKPLQINLQRCGVTNTVITLMEGRWFKNYTKKFDKIMVDAPCSGIGTIRKSIKTIEWWNPNFVKQMAGIQKQLLETGFNLLKEDGVLVYSTCTLEPEENEGVIHNLLSTHEDAKLEKISLEIKKSEPVLEFEGQTYNHEIKKCLRIWPQDNDTEGFFVAKIRKS